MLGRKLKTSINSMSEDNHSSEADGYEEVSLDTVKQSQFRKNKVIPSKPTEKKSLVCCTICGLVKNVEDFKSRGCENCNQLDGYNQDDEKLDRYTTKDFEGFVSCDSKEYINNAIV